MFGVFPVIKFTVILGGTRLFIYGNDYMDSDGPIKYLYADKCLDRLINCIP